MKPNCPPFEKDGDIITLTIIASRALRNCGMEEEAIEMYERIRTAGSYDKALEVVGEYVNITSVDDGEGEGEGIGSGLSPDDDLEEDYGMEM